MSFLLRLKQTSVKFFSLFSVFVLLFTQLYYIFLPERDIYAKADNTVRIMSFNVLSARTGDNSMFNRKEIVAQTIAEYFPDSIGLQEATPQWMLWLNTQLPEYDYVGVGRDNGRLKGEFSAIFYLKDKYKVVDSGTFWISETPNVPSMGWDADCMRICTWAVLENKTTGQQYAHINTHLDYNGTLPRERGVAMILEKAASYNIPVVSTGDFNLREGSNFYKQLTGGVLFDTKFLAPDTMKNATIHHFTLPTDPSSVIDYVLVNSKVTPLVYRVIIEGIDGKFVSDHYPLYTDVILNTD
ncbi:MAG: endonuclease/exonuclease/phosphatase family protein [Eubacteriales bacterium]